MELINVTMPFEQLASGEQFIRQKEGTSLRPGFTPYIKIRRSSKMPSLTAVDLTTGGLVAVPDNERVLRLR